MIEHILEMNREIHLEEFNDKYIKEEVKSLCMIHIPGVNDKAYATYINNLSSIESNNLWFTLP